MRSLTSNDITAVCAIDALSFAPYEQYNSAFYRELAESHGYEAIVATIPDGTIVGWILADIVRSPVRIRSISVHPEYRRKGFGYALLTEILSAHSEVDLLVEPDNVHALRLYQRLGFVITDGDPEMPERIRMLWTRCGDI